MSSIAIDDLQFIHLEITNKCNLRCPGCARTEKGETHPYLADQLMEWTLEKVKEKFPPHIVKNKIWTLGGTVDEPLMNKDIYSICEYLVQNEGYIEIFTNASANTEETFQKLGKLSYESQSIDVKFSVDGYEDTNHFYRVNAVWDKIVKNMTAFSSQQGICEWQYLVFEHNQKSIEPAKKLADQLQIPFVLRQNVRNTKPWTSYIKKKIDGKVVTEKFLVYPTTSKKVEHPETEKVKNWSHPKQGIEQNQADSIFCMFEHKKEIFIDWSGKVWPCCWFATDYHFEKLPVLLELDKEFGEGWNSVHNHSLESIIQSPYYKELLVQSWIEGAKFHNPECFKKCGDFAKRRDYKFSTVQ